MTNFQCKKLDPLVVETQVTTVSNVYKVQLLVLVDLLIESQLTEMWWMKKVIIQVVEMVGYVLNVIGLNVIVVMKKFMTTKTAHLTMCIKVMSQQSFLMVHTESTTNV